MKSYDDEFPLLQPHGLYAADTRGDGESLFKHTVSHPFPSPRPSCHVSSAKSRLTLQEIASSTPSPTNSTAPKNIMSLFVLQSSIT